MSGYAKQLARDKIARLAGQGLDLVTFWREASEPFARAVPHYTAPCWFTLDPASLLITSHYQTEFFELPPGWLAHEYFEDDVHKMTDVVRSERGISTVHEATGGDPSRSPGWNRYVRPYGGDQELIVALRTRTTGDAWGVMTLYRELGQSLFDAEEIGFLREVAPYLAEGAQRGLLVGEATDPEGPEAPGLVILREDWSVESLTPGTERWLADLPGDWEARGALPPAVLAVAGRALRTAEGPEAPGEVALARVLSREGRWVVLHGAALVGDGARRVAIIVEPAHPARISPLLMSAYGLTEREQEVTRLVLQGNSTAEIAERLMVVPQTVQQHLKSVFEKTGVRSRRELIGKVFFTHYEPRLHDNEQRAIAGQPLRGGPLDRVEGVGARG